MEYYRDPKNQIQADIAYRLGLISAQYSSLKDKMSIEEDYSVTLNIAILQNMLTNCLELLRSMSKKKRKKNFLKAKLKESKFWGLSEKMIVKNTFAQSENLTVEDFLTHLRNALSHPTQLNETSDFPSTGYTTIVDNSGIIRHFQFISSPDTKKNRPKQYSTEAQATNVLQKAKETGNIPKGITIGEHVKNYVFQKDGKPFARIFIAEISTKQLELLVRGLCNYLAQPIQDSWDGETIAKLIA